MFINNNNFIYRIQMKITNIFMFFYLSLKKLKLWFIKFFQSLIYQVDTNSIDLITIKHMWFCIITKPNQIETNI